MPLTSEAIVSMILPSTEAIVGLEHFKGDDVIAGEESFDEGKTTER